jgi:hypothetical protein
MACRVSSALTRPRKPDIWIYLHNFILHEVLMPNETIR